MSFTVFNDRFDPKYHRHLAGLLGDLDKLCEHATAPQKDGTVHDQKFTKGITLYFCGLAATTLLGVCIKGEKQSPQNIEISRLFERLLSKETTDRLAAKGVYLKIRFVFSYVYSTFYKSLVEAEASLSRPRVKGKVADRNIDYNFTIQSVITKKLVEDSTLYKCQVESLKKIAALVEKNPYLVMTRPERNDHTLQVRFATIPMPLCLMILNNKAYSDPYLYSQENSGNGVHNLFYHSPVQVFDDTIDFQKKYYTYLSNHFDYLWNNEITLLCKDATLFDLERNCQGLSKIRKPEELIFTQKENRIKDFLNKDKEAKKYDEKDIAGWKAHLIKKLAVYLGTETISTIPPEETRHPVPAPIGDFDNENSLEIGKKGNKYYFTLQVPSEDVTIHFEKNQPHLVYQLFLHAAVANHGYQNPVMHIKHKHEARIFRHILSPLSHVATKKGVKFSVDYEFLVTHIFQHNKEYKLNMNKERIKITGGYPNWADKLSYDGIDGAQWKVLDFEL